MSRQCTHVRMGRVTNQPDKYDHARPHASVSVCARPACIERAIAYVASQTNETAVHVPDQRLAFALVAGFSPKHPVEYHLPIKVHDDLDEVHMMLCGITSILNDPPRMVDVTDLCPKCWRKHRHRETALLRGDL